jgi:hypothetical protein
MDDGKAHTFISRLGKPFIHIYLCSILLLFGWTAYNTLRYPYGINYGEAPIINQARSIENKEILYKEDLNEPPFVIANYPPLYPAAIAVLNSILNIPLLQSGRAISIFFSLVSATIISFFSYELTQRKLFAFFSAALFLGNPFVLVWSPAARVDMMALGFSLLGLWTLYKSKSSSYWLIATVVFFILAIYTKQSYLFAGPLAGLIWLWHQNKRHALYFMIAVGGLTLLIFGMINAITNGGFYTNIVLATIGQYRIAITLLMFKSFLTVWLIILIISILTLLFITHVTLQVKATSHNDNNSLVFMVYGLGGYSLGAVISALAVGKIGSDANYFLELIAVCSIWCGIGLMYILDQGKTVKYVCLGLLSIQMMWVFVQGIKSSHDLIGTQKAQIKLDNILFEQVKKASQKGIVLSDDYLDLIVLSGQSIYYAPFEYNQVYYAGLWNPDLFIEQINQRLFPLILTDGNNLDEGIYWSPIIVEAIESNYTMQRNESALILTPK